MPHQGGILLNDTAADAVRYASRDGKAVAVPVPKFPTSELEFQGIDDWRVARQGFGRGLCVLNERLIAAGSSPSTVSIIDIVDGRSVTAVNLTMDIRNAIHGLEQWPAGWA